MCIKVMLYKTLLFYLFYMSPPPPLFIRRRVPSIYIIIQLISVC